MLTYDLTNKKKYIGLYTHIRQDILCGRISAGEKLPSKRALAEHLSLSVITVQNAYEQLLAEGYICAKERSGYYACEVQLPQKSERLAEEYTPPKQPIEEVKLNFTKGSMPPELFPFSVWAKLNRRVLCDFAEQLLQRVPCDGDSQLKVAIADYLYRSRGISVSPKYIVVGAGAEYLYGIIVQLLGKGVYAVENPGYGNISKTYSLYGATCLPVNVGKEGISLSCIAQANPIAVHISPSHQFPTGAVMPASRRTKLIQWAEQNNAYLIEDDYDSEFRLGGKPLQSMVAIHRERVIYMNTFSKSLAPSLRMGYMVLPPELYDRYLALFGTTASVVPLFEQRVLAQFIADGSFERHLGRLRHHYAKVREQLLDWIAQIPHATKVQDTGSGLHLTVRFEDFDDEKLRAFAQQYGLRFRCLSDYLLSPQPHYQGVAVLNYSGITIEQLQNFQW